MDVGGWLRDLALGQYEANFRDNKIDADLLPRLTGDDLKDIGVFALGDRLRLLEAIAALVGAKPPSDVPALPPKSASPKGPEVSAERRPITVMFCDLVGSTNLAAKMDAEDWRTLVNTYLDEASAAVTGLGGQVLKKLGDGLMALFGYPRRRTTPSARSGPGSRSSARLSKSTPETSAKAPLNFPRASALIPGEWWSTQRVKCSAMRPILPRESKAPPSRALSSSQPPSNGRPRD